MSVVQDVHTTRSPVSVYIQGRISAVKRRAGSYMSRDLRVYFTVCFGEDPSKHAKIMAQIEESTLYLQERLSAVEKQLHNANMKSSELTKIPNADLDRIGKQQHKVLKLVKKAHPIRQRLRTLQAHAPWSLPEDTSKVDIKRVSEIGLSLFHSLWSLCVSLSLSLCLSLPMSLSLSLSLSLSVCLFVFLSFFLSFALYSCVRVLPS
jgi:hypothetical protein